ncbi:MAG: CpXC domain-containing protein [Anaerolineae bacterium]|nr:CpXC domain-containing protein [Anaerolineae bacterium]
MPPRYLAAVTCPSCGTRFQTPVQQVLDVRADPDAASRVLSGGVNVAICPSCGTGGALNLPFVYHDPEKEIALLYLPIESGPTMVERQKVAGRLTRQVMDAMPPEERKGYLLQPETFISMDTLVKRVLELEGVSEEDLARSQSQREFVGALLQASQDQWPEMVAEKADLVDEGLFAFLEYVMQLTQASSQQVADTDNLEALHEYLVQETEVGQALAKRSEIVRSYAENPTRETLLDALIRASDQASDEDTIRLLVESGVSLMDYGFFQRLNARIEEASADEETALKQLRRKILDLRDHIVEAGEGAVRERATLLGKLLSTEDPARMANSHLSELDDLFFVVLGSQLQEAQQQGDQGMVEALQKVTSVVNQAMESTMPPEIALTRRLMAAPSDEALTKQLQAVRRALTPRYLQFLEAMEDSLREQGQDEAAERLAEIRAKAAQIAPEAGQPSPEPPAVPEAEEEPEPVGDGEKRTPSGLIIAKR